MNEHHACVACISIIRKTMQGLEYHEPKCTRVLLTRRLKSVQEYSQRMNFTLAGIAHLDDILEQLNIRT